MQQATVEPSKTDFKVVCPTPSKFNAKQSKEIANALQNLPPDLKQPIGVLAVEWDRLDAASRICRGA